MSDIGTTTERRRHPELRVIFPAICEALKPFFDPASRWEGQSHEHLAYRTLKEQFPGLSAQDSLVVMATVKRLIATGKFPPAP